MRPAEAFGLLAISAILGVGMPWLGMRMLVPSLQDSERATTTNYRGWRVFYGLGVVWFFWSGSAIVAGALSGAIASGGSVLALLVLAGPLAMIAFALGLFDDAYGSSASRGFKGHLKALASGRLTTGGLKLFGISAASYVAALFLWEVSPWGQVGDVFTSMSFVMALPAGAAIALTSNFLNLTDLRPGRALKVYTLLAFAGVASVVLGVSSMFEGNAVAAAVDAVCLLLFALGPVLAVWRYDVREWGMLGDAGANPMGAVAGLLIVAGLPPIGLFVYLIAIFALNLASERVSFSRVIEGNGLLRRIDAIGRLPEVAQRDEGAGHPGDSPPGASTGEN